MEIDRAHSDGAAPGQGNPDSSGARQQRAEHQH